MNPADSSIATREAELLYKAGRLLASTLEPERVYDLMRDLVSGIMDCDGLLVSTFDPEDRMIRCAYAWIEGNKVNPADLPAIPLAPEGQGMQSTVIRSGEPLKVDDLGEQMKRMTVVYHVDRDGGVHDESAEGKPETGSTLLVPIRLEGQVLGIVQLMSHRKAAYTVDHLRLLEGLTLQMAAASRNAWIYRTAQVEIAERKKAQEQLHQSEERFRQLAENIGAVFFMTENPGGRSFGQVIYVSPAYEKVWGRSCRSAIESPAGWFDSVHPEDRLRVHETLERIGESSFEQEFRIVRPDGAVRWIHDRLFPVKDATGRIYRWAGIAEDITERKELETALRERMEALAEADVRKDEFLAMLSHELRNPLGPIRNAVYLLKLSGREVPREAIDTDSMLAIIDRQVTHMARMIDDLLDMSGITRRKLLLRKERLDLIELIRGVAEDMGPLLESHRLVFEVNLPGRPVWVHGDATRLAQAVGNMLHNADKFTDPGGRVALTTGIDDAGTAAFISVVDTGMGIEKDLLGRIFEPFTQADRTLARSRGGLGLGLALVRGLVELHHGTVEVYSEGPGQGSRFTIRLPVLEAPSASGKRARTRGSVSLSRKILVIEDHVDAADSLRMLLEFAGHVVEVAYAGMEGVDKARVFQPEVVLCDIGLPGSVDGYQVAALLRSDPVLRDVSLIALTGFGQDEDLKRVRVAGFDRHLVKPVDPGLLRQLLDGPLDMGDGRLEQDQKGR